MTCYSHGYKFTKWIFHVWTSPESNIGPYLMVFSGARHKSKVQRLNLFKPCNVHLFPLLPGEVTLAPPSPLLAHREYSYQLFTLTSSIHGCVFCRRCNNQSESLLSLPLKTRCTHGAKHWRGYQVQTRFSCHETDLLAWSVKVMRHYETAGRLASRCYEGAMHSQ